MFHVCHLTWSYKLSFKIFAVIRSAVPEENGFSEMAVECNASYFVKIIITVRALILALPNFSGISEN